MGVYDHNIILNARGINGDNNNNNNPLPASRPSGYTRDSRVEEDSLKHTQLLHSPLPIQLGKLKSNTDSNSLLQFHRCIDTHSMIRQSMTASMRGSQCDKGCISTEKKGRHPNQFFQCSYHRVWTDSIVISLLQTQWCASRLDVSTAGPTTLEMPAPFTSRTRHEK